MQQFFRAFRILFLYYLSCFLLLFLAERFLSAPSLFIEKNFLNWDAMHYQDIMQHGYQNENVAFFPLFPFLWKGLQLSPVAISMVNALIYILSFSWLASVFNISTKNLLLFSSVPSLLFMFLPFSEAVFFLTSSMVLVGYKQNRFYLLAAGIFLSGLCRPVVVVFIPAILIAEYLSQHNRRLPASRILLLVVLTLISLFVVMLIQYVQTGEWLAFFKMQKEWGNYWRLPSLPFTSWAGGLIVRLDAVAFALSAASLAALVYIFRNRKKEAVKMLSENKAIVFSLSYLGMLALVVLFSRGGTLNSLNRYLLSTAFFIIALNTFAGQRIFNLRNLLILFASATLFWLLFASYVHIQSFLKFELLTAYLLLLFIYTSANKRIMQTAFYLLFLTNTFFLLFFMHRFLSGGWVG